MAKLAVHGGTPVFQGSFPHWPVVDDEDRKALVGVLDSGVWGIGGKQAEQFQEEWARFTGASHCVVTSSGSTALVAALRACGVGAGDEVIMPAYTFQATATSALLVDAVPVFADIDPNTYCLDPKATEAAITLRTRAVVPVHVAGCPCDMDAFQALAEKHRLVLLEDACQAHGAAWKGKKVGSLGLAGAFSFQSSKNLPAGEGGAVTTSDQRIAALAAAVHNCGNPGMEIEIDPVVGTNHRMTEFQAAILRSQMRRLPEQIAKREENAAVLDRELAKIPGLAPTVRLEGVTTHAYHLYMFRYDAAAFGAPREAFIRAMQAEGIPCHGGYQPLYRAGFLCDAMRETPTGGRTFGDMRYHQLNLPATEKACQEAVWLTQRLLLSPPEQTQAIIDAAAKIYECRGELDSGQQSG